MSSTVHTGVVNLQVVGNTIINHVKESTDGSSSNPTTSAHIGPMVLGCQVS
jgi:hypothetical protein